MPDVVVHRGQTQRVSVNQKGQRTVENVIFNPIQIATKRDTVSIPSWARVVISERTVKELDTARMISGETPTPTTDGAEKVFTTAYPYVVGSLRVTRGSLRMHPTADYSETDPTVGTFTMVVAPDAVEPLITDYIKA